MADPLAPTVLADPYALEQVGLDAARVAAAQAAAERADIVARVSRVVIPRWQRQLARCDRIDGWLGDSPDKIEMPRRATAEHRQLADMSAAQYVGLAVTTLAQTLAVDGYRRPGQTEDAAGWARWRANGMPARQVSLWRAALAYGEAYLVVTPGAPVARMRPMSPRRVVAIYDDPAVDEWPSAAADVRALDDGSLRVTYWDADRAHYLAGRPDALAYVGAETHGAGVVPVVRVPDVPDLEGRAVGEVEPLLPIARRINKSLFDRLVTQHFNSWKVWTISGIDLAKGPAATNTTPTGSSGSPSTVPEWLRAEQTAAQAAEANKLRLRQGDILTAADPATKFGALPETQLDGFVRAYEADVRELAVAAQLSPVVFGDVSNVSAEAIAMLQHGQDSRSAERRLVFGEAVEQAQRLAAALEGDVEGAADLEARVTWQDTSVRSLAQAADAFGKLVQMLNVPPAALWGRIPGIDATDVADWQALARGADPLARMADDLAATTADALGGPTAGPATPTVAEQTRTRGGV